MTAIITKLEKDKFEYEILDNGRTVESGWNKGGSMDTVKLFIKGRYDNVHFITKERCEEEQTESASW